MSCKKMSFFLTSSTSKISNSEEKWAHTAQTELKKQHSVRKHKE